MPQQRIHEATARRLTRLSIAINNSRRLEGLKLKTVPDIIEDITEMFEIKRNQELRNNNADR